MQVWPACDSENSKRGRGTRKDHEVDAEPDLIVTNTVRLIVPVIQIFAFYVLAHGHVSRVAVFKVAWQWGQVSS